MSDATVQVPLPRAGTCARCYKRKAPDANFRSCCGKRLKQPRPVLPANSSAGSRGLRTLVAVLLLLAVFVVGPYMMVHGVSPHSWATVPAPPIPPAPSYPRISRVQLPPLPPLPAWTRLFPRNLRQATFRSARLGQTRLAQANLSEADFRGADFFTVDLSHANLSHADLRETRHQWTDFQDADLRGADLRGADLINAERLTAAQLASARTDATTRLPGQ